MFYIMGENVIRFCSIILYPFLLFFYPIVFLLFFFVIFFFGLYFCVCVCNWPFSLVIVVIFFLIFFCACWALRALRFLWTCDRCCHSGELKKSCRCPRRVYLIASNKRHTHTHSSRAHTKNYTHLIATSVM